MKYFIFSTLCIVSSQTLAWENSPSVGFGLKYGGFIGFQTAFFKGKHNLRGAVGAFGMSAGYDYKLLNNFSIGATTGEYSNLFSGFKAHTLNLTYFATGKYSQGWNISIDIGKKRCIEDCLDDDENYNSLSWYSFGYTF
jgi:hypothetical protein